MTAAVLALTSDWDYDVVSLGVPGPVAANTVAREPVNLGPGWVGFDFTAAFGRPTRVVNDAVMQALGCYEGGRMLFLGLGTGLGNTLIVRRPCGRHGAGPPALPQRQAPSRSMSASAGSLRLGKRRWRKAVNDVVVRLKAAIVADYVVLGGGNAKLVDPLPKGCRLGDNRHAFIGGLRLWDEPTPAPALVQAA